MNALFTVMLTVICPNNQQFTSFKPDLTYSEAVKEVEYFESNPSDDIDDDGAIDSEQCIIVNPTIERQGA